MKLKGFNILYPPKDRVSSDESYPFNILIGWCSGMRNFSRIKDKDTFVRCVAEDCVKNMSGEDKDYIRKKPSRYDHHFGYALYIRNRYIHGNKLSIGWYDPDSLSGDIMEYIFSILLPDEFIANDEFCSSLYNNKGFSQARNEYIRMYGKAPIEIMKKYREEYLKTTEALNIEEEQAEQAAEEFFNLNKESLIERAIKELGEESDSCIDGLSAKELKKYAKIHAQLKTILESTAEIRKDHWNTKHAIIDRMMEEISEIIWQEDAIWDRARSYGIFDKDFAPVIEELKEAFRNQLVFVPLETAFLKFRDNVEESVYTNIRGNFIKTLEKEWRLIREMGPSWFDDREVARVAIDEGFGLDFLKQFQDDEEMVRYALEKDGSQISYVSERLKDNREIVLLAKEHKKK